MNGDDEDIRASWNFRPTGKSGNVHETARKCDLDFSRCGFISRHAQINLCPAPDSLAQSGRAVGPQAVQAFHQGDEDYGKEKADANSSQNRDPDGKAVLAESRATEAHAQAHRRNRFQRNEVTPGKTIATTVHVAVMTKGENHNQLDQDQPETDVADVPKELSGKRILRYLSGDKGKAIHG